MDRNVALDRLVRGQQALADKLVPVQRRENYRRGVQDLPYAPDGVNDEYVDLQEQSIASFMGIAVGAPVQRMRVDGLVTGLGDEADKKIWNAWQANKMDSRQSLVYESMVMHGRGICSVWPNKKNRARPIVRPESFELVHVEMDPDDPFTILYVVKVYEIQEASPLARGLILPGSTSTTKTIGIVYDDESLIRFEKGGLKGNADWEAVLEGTHPMRGVPFALHDYQPDAKGQPWSAIDPLLHQQDALNTIRFNTLLAMQFSAFRQRIITGFDPRVVDSDGNFMYRTDDDGNPLVDANGNAVPMLNSPGRVGVDRLLAFPGGDTKVFDLAESNLENYVSVYDKFLTTLFSTGQIPPQYMLDKMANLSGDALAGAESTLASLVHELQLAAGEGNETMAELMWYAMGEEREFSASSETLWADEEARSFSQIVDAIVKLVSVDFPKRSAFEMIPGATKPKVDRWMEELEDESFANRLALVSRPFTDATVPVPPVNDQTEITNGAPAGGN